MPAFSFIAFIIGNRSSECRSQRFADPRQPARQTEWVVYVKRPFAGRRQVLGGVGRSTPSVALANQRLLDLDEGHQLPASHLMFLES